MSEVLAGIGLVAAALASGAAILLPPGRLRALVMVAAICAKTRIGSASCC